MAACGGTMLLASVHEIRRRGEDRHVEMHSLPNRSVVSIDEKRDHLQT